MTGNGCRECPASFLAGGAGGFKGALMPRYERYELFGLVREADAYQAWTYRQRNGWIAVSGGSTPREATRAAALMGYLDCIVKRRGEQPQGGLKHGQ